MSIGGIGGMINGTTQAVALLSEIKIMASNWVQYLSHAAL